MRYQSTFAPFSIASIANDVNLPHYVAVQAGLHQLKNMDYAAAARSDELADRLMQEISDGPGLRSDLRKLLILAATEAAVKNTDPMLVLPPAMQQRSEEFRSEHRVALIEWLKSCLAPASQPEAETQLTRVLLRRKVKQQVSVKEGELRGQVETFEQKIQQVDEELRKRTAALQRAKGKLTDSNRTVVYSPRSIFLAVFFLFFGCAVILKVLTEVPFLPVPFSVVVSGVGIGIVAARRVKRQATEVSEVEDQPFLAMRTPLIAYANIVADAQKIEQDLQILKLVREELESSGTADALPELLGATRSLLEQQHRAISTRFWCGDSPTFGALTGKALVTALWDVRKERWTAASFQDALREVHGEQGVEDLLLTERPDVSANILCQAADAAMLPINFVETTEAMINVVPGGRRALLGEFESQIGLLKGMFTIESYQIKSAEPACPQLVHVILPAALAGALRPLLVQAMPNETFNFYTNSEDDVIQVCYETFNRAHAERSSYRGYQDSFRTYEHQAASELWSAFGPLLVQQPGVRPSVPGTQPSAHSMPQMNSSSLPANMPSAAMLVEAAITN